MPDSRLCKFYCNLASKATKANYHYPLVLEHSHFKDTLCTREDILTGRNHLEVLRLIKRAYVPPIKNIDRENLHILPLAKHIVPVAAIPVVDAHGA